MAMEYLNDDERRIVRTALLMAADRTMVTKAAVTRTGPGSLGLRQHNEHLAYLDKLEGEQRRLAHECGDDVAVVMVRR